MHRFRERKTQSGWEVEKPSLGINLTKTCWYEAGEGK